MFNKRVLRIFVCGVAMLGVVATSEADCYTPHLVTEMQIQSVTIDGVAQTDLTEYQKSRTIIYPSLSSRIPSSIDVFFFGQYGERYDPQ